MKAPEARGQSIEPDCAMSDTKELSRERWLSGEREAMKAFTFVADTTSPRVQTKVEIPRTAMLVAWLPEAGIRARMPKPAA
jgi:hypothetical protein